MGKVLDKFTNGWPGAASRAIDEIIISMKNGFTIPAEIHTAVSGLSAVSAGIF